VKRYLAVVVLLVVALGAPGLAQDQKPAATPAATLKVQLTLSRHNSDKKISSLPYMLTVNTDERPRGNGRASLRLGTLVPITTMARQGGDANAPMVPTVQYRDVGTSIDCIVSMLDDGRYKLDLTVEDSSLDNTSGSAGNSPHPAFRSFRTSNTLLLRDGQSAQYVSATDKVSGDVWKVDVSLAVVK
jgi:type II secretory pathway component GspD/PulD (secretin)